MKIIASFAICYLSKAPVSWEYLSGENVECLLPSFLEQTLVKSRDCVDSGVWLLTLCVWHMSPVSPWVTYLPVKGLHCQPSSFLLFSCTFCHLVDKYSDFLANQLDVYLFRSCLAPISMQEISPELQCENLKLDLR